MLQVWTPRLAGLVATALVVAAPITADAKGKAKQSQRQNDDAKDEADAESPHNDGVPPPPPPPPPRGDKGAREAAAPSKSAAIHPDYYKELGRSQAMSSGGWGVTAGGLGMSLAYALSDNGAYAIPLVGPYIGIADEDSVGGLFLGLTLGTMQVIALPIAIVGTVRKVRIQRRIRDANAAKSASRRSGKLRTEWTGSGLTLRF
jgi:hypothetical protein